MKRSRWAIALLLACAAPAVATAVEGLPVPNAAVVERGITLSGQPDATTFDELAARGVQVVINLRSIQEGPDWEPSAATAAGMRYVHIPVTPAAVGLHEVDLLERALEDATGPVLIHCSSGNRAGGLWGALRARRDGLSVEEAVVQARRAGMSKPVMEEALRRILAEARREESKDMGREQFLYRIQPTRPAMLTEGPTEAEQEIVSRHFAYLKDLKERGIVLLAGRTLNTDGSSFGIVIFEAASEAAARELMEADPAVRGGVMRAELFPYRVALEGFSGSPGDSH